MELSQSQLDYTSLLEEFDQYKADAKEREYSAYDEGIKKAENDLALQIPQLRDAFFSKGWHAALAAAGVPSSFELFSRHSLPSSSQPLAS